MDIKKIDNSISGILLSYCKDTETFDTSDSPNYRLRKGAKTSILVNIMEKKENKKYIYI